MEDVPLIFTTRGNVPISELEYQTRWEDTPDYTKFVERYVASDGEVVKESAHVYDRKGVFGAGTIAQL